MTYVPSRDCLVFPKSGPGLDITCVDLNSLALGSAAWAPAFNIKQTGPKLTRALDISGGGQPERLAKPRNSRQA